tara:strand:- start:697 stop:1101 length:405 start_codon:yes stop_codon:yes gene_type:complete
MGINYRGEVLSNFKEGYKPEGVFDKSAIPNRNIPGRNFLSRVNITDLRDAIHYAIIKSAQLDDIPIVLECERVDVSRARVIATYQVPADKKMLRYLHPQPGMNEEDMKTDLVQKSPEEICKLEATIHNTFPVEG